MGDKEVSSELIGEMVIETLRELDQVAYVRFASVYREFSDVSEFVDTLRQLAAKKAKLSQLTKGVGLGKNAESDSNVLPLDSRLSRSRKQKLHLLGEDEES
jgi:hypothetical protein